MSRLGDLITQLCPDGVEFQRLDEIGVLYSGLTGKSKADFAAGNARFVSYVNVFNNLSTDVEPGDRVQVRDGERQNRVQYGDVLFTASSESADEVGMASGVTVEPSEPLYLNSFCFGFRPHHVDDLDPEFTKHLFRSAEIRRQIIRTANGVTRINISKARFRAIKIPVPPLAIQREIAAILDKMESLKAELEAELELRSRQYAFYRDSLLTFAETEIVRWATLGDISVRVSSGATPTAGRSEYYEGGTIPWLRTSEVRFNDIVETEMRITERALRETGAKWIPADCVIVAISGATAGRSAVNKIPMTTNQHCCNLEIDPEQADYRYVFQWVSHHYEVIKALGRGARADLSAGLIKSFEIALPPIDEQRRIALLLDRFDALVNDLSIGLPAEIKARQAQYEYYRDKLLTFEELAA
ncbi:restriction endonuclease subunit S [Nocardioides sp.]|uniref:restriction endonuclease subunit S n=1 Tax=Nocardioides sp. TaxID=35761 RepID=UPI0025F89083|nr:restriction endonuclease subunit S [Nocardioides sp.]